MRLGVHTVAHAVPSRTVTPYYLSNMGELKYVGKTCNANRYPPASVRLLLSLMFKRLSPHTGTIGHSLWVSISPAGVILMLSPHKTKRKCYCYSRKGLHTHVSSIVCGLGSRTPNMSVANTHILDRSEGSTFAVTHNQLFKPIT